MKKLRQNISRLAILLIHALPAALAAAEGSDTNAVAPGRTDAQFSESAPYASRTEVLRRLGAGSGAVVPDYDISKEQFQIIQPAAYATNTAWGLFVWISPAEDARMPPDWEPELARHRLLAVSAHNSGNNRRTFDRVRLALDATCNMCRRFNIERKRIYVGGFSGGARVASILGVAYADIFTGTLCVCGVDFYQKIPFAREQFYPATYLPNPHVLPLAKRNGRFVLLTGENDVNRENTKLVLEKGFQHEGFRNVLYLEVPGMKHALPGAEVLNTALDYLDGNKVPSGAATADR